MKKLEQQILDFISHPDYKPVKRNKLSSRLNLADKLVARHKEALQSLIDAGKVYENKRGRLKLKSALQTIAGVIKRTSSGAGFVIPHDRPSDGRKGDIYVAPTDMGDAYSGDEVLVQLLKGGGRSGRRTGRIEEVVERATSTFVGTYFEDGGNGFVRVDGTTFNDPIFVGDPGAKGAQPDDKVVIEMVRFPTHFQAGEAVLTTVLGPRGEVGIDTLSIVHEFGLPTEFSDEVLAEAHRQADEFDETNLAGRRDLTKETIVTIDPADARDFDDAISLEQTPDGHWHLGVHIADVAHFVQPGSPLDIDARFRGTSVYLPHHVIPMLPEVISNSLASLQQGKVRYTKSAFIEYSAEGIPLHTEFANSAIRVTRRFAYEEVLPIVREPDRFKSKVAAKVRALLSRMHTLAMLLRRRRFEAGALELNLPEIKIDFDKDGRVCGAHESEHDQSHQIIEEFMLAANVAVATELSDRDLTFLRRAHPDPDERKLKLFSEFTKALGHPLQQYQSRRALQKLIDRVRDEPPEHAVNYALLRSMKQAVYTGDVFGHYALGEENYCHFTSPIRRYPDLTIHRLIGALAKKKGNKRGMAATEVAKLAIHCCMTERRAAAAERELTKVKLLTYMEGQIGEELDAVITGVERFGLFCRGVEMPAEGFVHITAVDPNDYFDYEAATMTLTGRRGGRTYRLGDNIRVTVAHVDVDRRELDFRIVVPSKSKSRRSSTASARSQKKHPAGATAKAKPKDKKRKKRSARKKSTGKAARKRAAAKKTGTKKTSVKKAQTKKASAKKGKRRRK
ncbi:MAG: ribonuclease R [Planctomycetaceae bacterium]|jgi:ribonuclease R|nr:ribonuclease R [Planctomycetaceae bacterium]MBT6484161.1 ribonuclease R [Planctomycetaceae bacterium]MBT6493885.1 ribonuclease R [Planctomycetaceae bacterium]